MPCPLRIKVTVKRVLSEQCQGIALQKTEEIWLYPRSAHGFPVQATLCYNLRAQERTPCAACIMS